MKLREPHRSVECRPTGSGSCGRLVYSFYKCDDSVTYMSPRSSWVGRKVPRGCSAKHYSLPSKCSAFWAMIRAMDVKERAGGCASVVYYIFLQRTVLYLYARNEYNVELLHMACCIVAIYNALSSISPQNSRVLHLVYTTAHRVPQQNTTPRHSGLVH